MRRSAVDTLAGSPSLRFGLASFAVVVFVAARDLGALSMSAAFILGAIVGAVLLALALLEALLRALPGADPISRFLRFPAALVVVAVPLIHGVPAYWESRAALPGFAPMALVVTGLAVGALVAFARVPLGFDPTRWGRAVLVTSVGLSIVLLVVHVETSTMEGVRPGTGLLHLGLFLGTWILTAVFIVLSAARFAGETSRETSRAPSILGAAVLIVALAIGEVDHRALVGLYAEVHVWLGLLTILGLELGVRFFLVARRTRSWILSGAVASLCVIAWVVVGAWPGDASSIALRTELKRAPLGRSYIVVSHRSAPAPRAVPPPHPALTYDPMLRSTRPGKLPNILLVTIDAWRFDALGLGLPAPKMPFLAKLATESVRFTRAYAQGNRTAVAMSAIMLGRYSANLDWRLWFYAGGRIYDKAKLTEAEHDALSGTAFHTTLPVFAEGRTLAERLDEKGYYTLATPFARENEFFKAGVGFDKGFDDFVDLTTAKWRSPSSERVVRRALAQRSKIPRGAPWFHWVHLYDPHESRQVPATYAKLLRDTDDAVALLVGDIKVRGDWENTIAIFVADHGEAFGEHGMWNHGSSLYDEQIKVPLIVRIPGVAPRVEETPVGAIDIPATLTAMTGARTDFLDGVNLWPLLEKGTYPEGRPIFSELHRYMSRRSKRTGDMKAVVWGDHKLIIDRLADTAELFDLKNDPGEERNLLLDDPSTYQRYAELLESFIGRAEAEHPLP